MVLITGASGTVGRAVLEEVRRRGARVRAMYRSQADAVAAPGGTESVIADFSDKESLLAALKGVESVYLVCSPIPELVQLEGNMIEASELAGVRRIVLNSALGAEDLNTSFPSWHRKVEDKLKATKIAHCILRPNSFLQNLLAFFAPSIRRQGAFYNSLGNAAISYLDVRDIAAVAARVLVENQHDGKTYELNGPEALSCAQIAEKTAQHAGITVRYVEISDDAQRKTMLDQGMPEWQVKALLELQEYNRKGRAGTVDGVLKGLLERDPSTIGAFLTEHAGEFRPSAAAQTI